MTEEEKVILKLKGLHPVAILFVKSIMNRTKCEADEVWSALQEHRLPQEKI